MADNTQKSLKARFARHIQAIKDKHHPGALEEHFRKDKCSSIENVTMQPLHRVIPRINDTPEHIENTLKQHETLWIDRLKCEYPQGLNSIRQDPMTRYNLSSGTTYHHV